VHTSNQRGDAQKRVAREELRVECVVDCGNDVGA
jgi:hypothetical protein